MSGWKQDAVNAFGLEARASPFDADVVGMVAEDFPEVEPTEQVIFEGLVIEDGDGVALEPGEQAWAPVRTVAARTLAGSAAAQVGDRAPERGVVAVVLPAGGCALDVMPGLWGESSREHGMVQLVNASTEPPGAGEG